MIIPNPKSYTDEKWAEIVREQGGFWHAMDDMMGVHLVEAAEMILDQKEQKLLIDSIGDTMTKIRVLQSLLEEFQNHMAMPLCERGFDVKDHLEDIESLLAGTDRKVVNMVDLAYRGMLARSQINKEDEDHE